MRRSPVAAVAAVLLAWVAFPAARGDDPPKPEPAPPVQLTAQQDHKRMMDLLGI